MKKRPFAPGLLLVAGAWLFLSVFCWLKPDGEISFSERRKLAEFPELSRRSILSGKFASDFEAYSLDQFPARDSFRILQSLSAFYLFGQMDNHGIYLQEGFAAEIEYPLDRSSVEAAAEKLKSLYKRYIRGKTDRVYFSVIPDKNYYLAEEGGYPAMDYPELFSIMKGKMDFAEYLDLTGFLSPEDYYRTDTHWRQEKISDVASFLAGSMGTALPGEYRAEKVREDFRGVYYGQAALPMEGEKIFILHSSIIDRCEVCRGDTEKISGVYDLDKLEGRDPYEVYLSGAAPVIRIANPLCGKERRLVLFGDSFASSLAPLLAEGYSEITLVDIRYIDSSLIGDYADFQDADVLFLYSTLLLNSSESMR